MKECSFFIEHKWGFFFYEKVAMTLTELLIDAVPASFKCNGHFYGSLKKSRCTKSTRNRREMTGSTP